MSILLEINNLSRLVATMNVAVKNLEYQMRFIDDEQKPFDLSSMTLQLEMLNREIQKINNSELVKAEQEALYGAGSDWLMRARKSSGIEEDNG